MFIEQPFDVVVPYSVPLPYVYLPTSELLVPVHETVSKCVISIKFAIQQCLNSLSSMHSLRALVKGSGLLLNRFPCSILSNNDI